LALHTSQPQAAFHRYYSAKIGAALKIIQDTDIPNDTAGNPDFTNRQGLEKAAADIAGLQEYLEADLGPNVLSTPAQLKKQLVYANIRLAKGSTPADTRPGPTVDPLVLISDPNTFAFVKAYDPDYLAGAAAFRAGLASQTRATLYTARDIRMAFLANRVAQTYILKDIATTGKKGNTGGGGGAGGGGGKKSSKTPLLGIAVAIGGSALAVASKVQAAEAKANIIISDYNENAIKALDAQSTAPNGVGLGEIIRQGLIGVNVRYPFSIPGVVKAAEYGQITGVISAAMSLYPAVLDILNIKDDSPPPPPDTSTPPVTAAAAPTTTTTQTDDTTTPPDATPDVDNGPVTTTFGVDTSDTENTENVDETGVNPSSPWPRTRSSGLTGLIL
jgi:hypothetical protein